MPKVTNKLNEAETMTKRTQASMAEKFITAPGDVFTVTHSEGLSNTIPLRVTNENTCEDFRLSAPNTLDAWRLLKQLDEMGARSVMVEVNNGEAFTRDNISAIPFTESIPYAYRFKA